MRRRARTVTARSASSGSGLCSFAVGVPADEIKPKIDIYREGIAKCTQPIGAFVNDTAATFTMTVCAPTRDEAWADGARVVRVVPEGRRATDRERRRLHGGAEPGPRQLRVRRRPQEDDDAGLLDLLTLEYLAEAGACVLGTPDDCIELCKQYEAAGVDLLLCLVNPYKIGHEQVMQTIELMGTEVIPSFR